MNSRKAKVLFKFRTRMAPFGDNFKGGLDTPICPLCSAHPDTQESGFKCDKMKKFVDIKGEYSDIFVVVFSAELIETLYNVYGFREEYRKLREN